MKAQRHPIFKGHNPLDQCSPSGCELEPQMSRDFHFHRQIRLSDLNTSSSSRDFEGFIENDLED